MSTVGLRRRPSSWCRRRVEGRPRPQQRHGCQVRRQCRRRVDDGSVDRVVPGDCSHLQKTTSRHLARPAVADTSSVCRALAPAHKRMNELKHINQRNRTSETQPATRVKSDECCRCYRRVLSVHGERRLSVFLSVGTV